MQKEGDGNVKQTGCYRHELKYEISRREYLFLSRRLRPVLAPDKNARLDGRYLVQSIYFDNIYDKELMEKKNGVLRREKFRIRYYNGDLSHIRLEKKMKYGSLSGKESTELSEEECRKLLAKDISWMLRRPEPVLKELYGKIRHELLRPRIMVSYVREPYVYRAGNVRITFDFDIKTSLYHLPQLGDSFGISAADSPQTAVLEVKYDEFMPEFIGRMLRTEGICRQAFSKYEICRRFG